MTKFKTTEEAFAKNYAEKAHHQKSFNEKIIAGLVETIIQWFPDTYKNPLKILDLCCGHGEPTYNLLKQLEEKAVWIEKIVGYDNSPEQIERANTYAKMDKRLVFAVKDVEKMEDSNEYDIIFSLFGLHWMNNIENVTKNIYQAMKPQGKLFFFVPLEKMDLYEIRKEFSLRSEWREYFTNFSIHPFIKSEKGYTDFFDNYFDAEQVARGKITKSYSEQEFANFLSSWLQEVRHLASKGATQGDCENYVIQLTKSIPLNQINHSVTRFEANQDTKVRFVERFLSYQAAKKAPEAIIQKKPDRQHVRPIGRLLLNVGLFTAVAVVGSIIKQDTSHSDVPTYRLL